MASWSADISRLKKTTPAPADFSVSIPSSRSRSKRWAAAKAMLVPSEVLPMPGRPATISKIAVVKPADLGVEAVEPGGDARQMPAAVERALGLLERFLGRVGEALGAPFRAAFLGDLVELGLGALDLRQRSDLVAGVERALDHVAADPDERAQKREIVDLLGEIARADDRRAAAGQLGEIGRAADLAHRLVALEQGPQA